MESNRGPLVSECKSLATKLMQVLYKLLPKRWLEMFHSSFDIQQGLKHTHLLASLGLHPKLLFRVPQFFNFSKTVVIFTFLVKIQ